MKQLYMARPSGPVTPRPLPDGYRVEFFKGTQAEINDWVAICRCGLLPPDGGEEFFRSTILQYPDLVPADDLFFIVDPQGRRVATTAAVRHANGAGYVHMVASLPETRGRGLGHAMLAFTLSVIEARGVTSTTLTTDDFRLPAVKTYLDAGFRPVLWEDPDSDQKARWDAVIEKLGYSPVDYLGPEWAVTDD